MYDCAQLEVCELTESYTTRKLKEKKKKRGRKLNLFEEDRNYSTRAWIARVRAILAAKEEEKSRTAWPRQLSEWPNRRMELNRTKLQRPPPPRIGIETINLTGNPEDIIDLNQF